MLGTMKPAHNMVLRLVLAVASCWLPMIAQEASRTGEIEKAREEKAKTLEPDSVSKPERVLADFKDNKVIERFQAGINGFRLRMGGLATGSGFAIGPEYLREELAGGDLKLRGSAAISFKNYHLYDLELLSKARRGKPWFVQAYAVRHYYPSLQYYGQGPDSKKTGRSNYLYEDVALDGTAGWQPGRRFRVAGSGGYLFVNTGPGRDDRFASAESQYAARDTPGLGGQPNFARIGGFFEYDGTDNRLGPRSGSYVVGNYSHHVDHQGGRYSFDRLDLEVQQYVPFFNQRRVLAIRGKSNVTFTDAGKAVPFYMQPILGGSDDLRGFRPFRFYGDNLMVWNAEYRWEVFPALDMALFFDAGKVTQRRSQINFHELESSAGFGFRWNARNAVFLRLDVGFSHEGFQVWLKFNNIFAPKVIASSSSQIVQ